MADLHKIAGLVEYLIDEVRIRSDFQAFSGYGTQNMSDAVDRITGPTGYHLDVHKKLGDIGHSLAMVAIDPSA